MTDTLLSEERIEAHAAVARKYPYIAIRQAVREAAEACAKIAGGMMGEWIKVSDRLPFPGVKVIAYYKNINGKGRRIRAEWVPKFSMEDDGEFQGDCDYDEHGDAFWPEGWYETNEHEETSWRVDEEVTHWTQLPPPPAD